MGKENNIVADIILVVNVKSGEKIAPSIGMDIAKNDKSNILSFVVSDSACNRCSSFVCPGVARFLIAYFNAVGYLLKHFKYYENTYYKSM